MTPRTADVAAAYAEGAQQAVADVGLAAELGIQAEAWRRVALLISSQNVELDPMETGLAEYVRKLSTLIASGQPQLELLAESALRRLALTRAPELLGTGAPSALEVVGVQPSGRDGCVITVAVPEELRDRFAGSAGQHIVLHAERHGVPMRRSYSLLRSQQHYAATGTLSIAARREEQGRVSGPLTQQTRVGDLLVLSPPAGVFHPEVGNDPRHLLLLGAGSGVVPLIALAEESLETHADGRVTLIVVERSTSEVLAGATLEDLNRFRARFALHVEETGRVGRPTVERLVELGESLAVATQPYTDALTCGPESFTDAALLAAADLGIPSGRTRRETFVVGHEQRRVRPGGDVTLQLDGNALRLRVQPGESILGAILKSGHEVPYSCLSGSCGSCAVRVLAGQVAPQSPEVLGAPRTDEGWVLSCQAAPA